MRIADFQNPIANMPHMQQMQESQNQQARFIPVTMTKSLEEEIIEEQTTVQETKEESEKEQINEEDTGRGDSGRKFPRKRAAKMEEEETPKKRLSDGVHGRFLDIEI